MNKWMIGIGAVAAIGIGVFVFYRIRMAERQKDVFRKSTAIAQAAKGSVVPTKTKEAATVQAARSPGLDAALKGIGI